MDKSQVEVQFTLAIDEALLHHKSDAEYKAKEAYVLELLRQGDISAGKAAKLLSISRWDLSELMSAAGISPFAEQTAEELSTEVESALEVIKNQHNENCHK